MGSPITVPPTGTKTGYNSGVPSTFTIISNAVVSEPGGVQAKVSSTSTSDTASGLGGSGIQAVRIRYFDSNWTLNDEIVKLNGTTAVNTVATDIQRIESFESFQIGTPLGGAAGTIKLQNLGATQLFAQIDIGGNQFLRALHSVAPGKTGSITDIIVTSSTSGGVSFVVFKEVDNIQTGGNIALITDLSFNVVARVMQISLRIPVECNATFSTQALRMGISAMGLTTGQVALVSFHYIES